MLSQVGGVGTSSSNLPAGEIVDGGALHAGIDKRPVGGKGQLCNRVRIALRKMALLV